MAPARAVRCSRIVPFRGQNPSYDVTPPYSILHLGRCEEMDEVIGSEPAELLDDGSIEIEFANHHGDEAVLKPNGSLLK